jgi:hypothetical protein
MNRHDLFEAFWNPACNRIDSRPAAKLSAEGRVMSVDDGTILERGHQRLVAIGVRWKPRNSRSAWRPKASAVDVEDKGWLRNRSGSDPAEYDLQPRGGRCFPHALRMGALAADLMFHFTTLPVFRVYLKNMDKWVNLKPGDLSSTTDRLCELFDKVCDQPEWGSITTVQAVFSPAPDDLSDWELLGEWSFRGQGPAQVLMPRLFADAMI